MAVEATGVAVTGAAGILTGVLAVGVIAAIASLTDLQSRPKSAQAAFEGISQGDFNSWLTSATNGLKTAAISTEDLEAKSAQLKQALDLGVTTAQQYATAIGAIDEAMKRVAAEDLAGAVSQYSAGYTSSRPTPLRPPISRPC